MEKIRCPQCGKETRQNKHGKSEAGSQRYLCKHCKKTYVTKPKWRRYNEETKKQAIKLYMEGNSGRAVGRILGISINTCIYWKKICQNYQREKISKWESRSNRDGRTLLLHKEKKTEFT